MPHMPILATARLSIALVLPLLTAPPRQGEPEKAPWFGAWSDGTTSFLFEPGRVGWSDAAGPRFFRATWNEAGASLERWTRASRLDLTLDGTRLRVETGSAVLTLERMEDIAGELRVEPYELPEPFGLDEDILVTIREDLRERRANDQRVRQGDVDGPAMQRVDRDNTEWLLAILAELGWIDATRFGSEASDAAFLLVQHTSDLRLMRTALPRIEQDVRAGRLDGQAFALLHDRFQLSLGWLQRYGSQIGITADGEAVLMPCEDLEHVDERRAELGMGPLADYLALFQEGDRPIRQLDELRPGKGADEAAGKGR